MLSREKFASLLDKYILDTISDQERSELLAAIASGDHEDLLLEHIESNLASGDQSGSDLAPHRSAEILHNILSSEKRTAHVLPRPTGRVALLRRIAAAAAIVVVIFSAYFMFRKTRTNDGVVFTQGMTEIRNTNDHPVRKEMEDGSIITLQPGSVIHYPVHFLQNKREVYLEGEAFFEVSRNVNRPFYVYNKNVVTHVLGTSFNVRANMESGQVEVSVRTGRVEVYEKSRSSGDTGVRKNNGVILLPNQKTTYDDHAGQFYSTLVDLPLPVPLDSNGPAIASGNMVFEETPLRDVLGYLEKMYGVEIVVDNDGLYESVFTGDVNQQDLYTRLDIICQSVQATYEVKGTKILIKWNKP